MTVKGQVNPLTAFSPAIAESVLGRYAWCGHMWWSAAARVCGSPSCSPMSAFEVTIVNGLNRRTGVGTSFADRRAGVKTDGDPRKSVITTDAYFVNHLDIAVAYTTYAPRAQEYEEIIVIASAMAVRREKYHAFAMHLAQRSVVVTFDQAGTAGSTENSAGKDIRLTDWVNDLEYLVEMLAVQHGKPVVCIGHSIGGQLIGMINQRRIKKAIVIASQNGYWKNWRLRHRYLMLLGWSLIYLNTVLCGRLTLTSFVGLEEIPPGVAFDWIRWAMHDSYYDHNGENLDCRFGEFTGSLLYIGTTDDEIYAPARAGESLLRKYSKATKSCWIISPDEFGVKEVGHSGFFTDHIGESLWERMWNWMRS